MGKRDNLSKIRKDIEKLKLSGDQDFQELQKMAEQTEINDV